MSVNSVHSFPKVPTSLTSGINPPENAPAARTKIPPQELHFPTKRFDETFLPKPVLQVIKNDPNDVSAILKSFQNLSVHDQRSFLKKINNAGINLGLDVNNLSNEKVAQIFKSEEFAKSFSETFALVTQIASNVKISHPVESKNKLMRSLSAPATYTTAA